MPLLFWQSSECLINYKCGRRPSYSVSCVETWHQISGQLVTKAESLLMTGAACTNALKGAGKEVPVTEALLYWKHMIPGVIPRKARKNRKNGIEEFEEFCDR